MSSKTFEAYASIDVDLSEWAAEELVAELRSRDFDAKPIETDTLEEFYLLLGNKKPEEVILRVKDMIRQKLGKFV